MLDHHYFRHTRPSQPSTVRGRSIEKGLIFRARSWRGAAEQVVPAIKNYTEQKTHTTRTVIYTVLLYAENREENKNDRRIYEKHCRHKRRTEKCAGGAREQSLQVRRSLISRKQSAKRSGSSDLSRGRSVVVCCCCCYYSSCV